MTPEVRLATPGDRERVVGSLTAAFVADPVLRYLFPSDAEFRTGAPVFFGALFDKRVRSGTVWVADDGSAASLWDAPDGAGSSDLSGLGAGALSRLNQYDAAIHGALPRIPFWYLGVLGTHPDAAGRGLGRAVMAAGIAAAAESGLPCVLETSKPENLEYYARHGWQVTDVVDAPVRTWILRVNPDTPLARR
jgi:GNAT superfamily N-acetyltransferase